MSTTKSNNPKTSTIDDFVLLGKIGEGSFSTVHKVRRINDAKIYALKRIKIGRLKKKQQESAINQIRILASIESEYIISYRQSFFLPETEELCIVMEWANEGDLHNDISQYNKNRDRIPQSQIWRAIRDILFGLNTLHKRSIMHRDIKSANIFKSQGLYKLGDLNIAKVNKDLAYTQLGTPFYASPQVWNERPYDCKSDIWSFGCVIYEMCQLQPPFQSQDMYKLHQNIRVGKYPPISKIYSSELIKFVELCLKTNPKQRLNASQLLKLEWVGKKFSQNHVSCELNRIPDIKLMKTIDFPKQIKKMGQVLPQSNYKQNKSHRFHTKSNNKNLRLHQKIASLPIQTNSKKFFIKKKRNLKSAHSGLEANEKSVRKVEQAHDSMKKRPISAVQPSHSKYNYYMKKTPEKDIFRVRYNPDIISSLEIRKTNISREHYHSNSNERNQSYRKQLYDVDRSRQKEIREKLKRQPLSSIYHKCNNGVYLRNMMEPMEVPRIKNLINRNGERLRRQIGKLYNANIKKNVECLYP